jgi:hypothetical protein
MLDRLLEILDVDWSRAFVRWRGRVILVAVLPFPTATLGLIATWEQRRLDPMVKQIQQIGGAQTPPATPPATPGDLGGR